MREAEGLLSAAADEERTWRRFVPHVVGVLVLIVAGVFVYRLMSDDSTPRKAVSQVVTVKLVQPPPPPPPPKPEEPVKDKPEPTPEPLEKPLPAEQPPPLAAPSAPGPPGPPGPPGIAGLPSSGSGIGIGGAGSGMGGSGAGGGGGDPYASYAALLQSRVQGAVQAQPTLRRTRYRVDVKVWLSGEGSLERVELLNSLGSEELDKRFRQTLLSMSRLPHAPPANMPQPIVLQVNSL